MVVATWRLAPHGVDPDLADEKVPAERNSAGASAVKFLTAQRTRTKTYFSELLIEVNLSFRVDPRPLTTAMMASEIPAAIRPYSIAVAPDSSDKKLNRVRFNTASFRSMGWWSFDKPKIGFRF